MSLAKYQSNVNQKQIKFKQIQSSPVMSKFRGLLKILRDPQTSIQKISLSIFFFIKTVCCENCNSVRYGVRNKNNYGHILMFNILFSVLFNSVFIELILSFVSILCLFDCLCQLTYTNYLNNICQIVCITFTIDVL